MNIYFDIDGVVLDKRGNYARGVLTFITELNINHRLYWLSTHCKGRKLPALEHIRMSTGKPIPVCIHGIRPTNWQTLKTEAIDFTNPFVWFDDYCLAAEKGQLEKYGLLDCWKRVNLEANPNFFEYLSTLRVFFGGRI